MGGLLVVTASALLPQVHVHELVTSWGRRLTRRPSSPAWALIRALVLVAVGAGFILSQTSRLWWFAIGVESPWF